MRFKLSLTVDSRYNLLPMNHQYEVSSWIYKTMHQGNTPFSDWLHEQGYRLENKRFKLFTFSKIFVHPRWERVEDRIKIFSGRAELQLSFYVEEAVEHFIIGLFQNQRFAIGDRSSRAQFDVQTIEKLPDPKFSNDMRFRCLSPICISRSVEGKSAAEYLSPNLPGYSAYFFDNLLYKYIAASGIGSSLEELKAKMNRRQPLILESIGEPKSRLVKIKANTPQETRVRGYLYRFKITAPAELIEFGYQAGFGEKNSTGFGCVEMLNE